MTEPKRLGRTLQILRDIVWRDRALLAEAWLLIHVASVAVRFAKFKSIARLASLGHAEDGLEQPPEFNERANRVAWAIQITRKYNFLRVMCFETGLAAHLMLRRRGLNSTLYYGAAPGEDKPLEAHVWVTSNGHGITGFEIADRFAILAEFPE